MARSRILHAVRNWFHARGYLEVHTPLMVRSPAMEANLDGVAVGPRWLHTSPEFAMKRVIAAGLPRIYQICPCFREDEVGVHHSREFTMLEWYRTGAGSRALMDDVVDLIAIAADAVEAPRPAWQRIPTRALLDPTLPPDEWYFQWVDQVEPTLPDATIVFDYPVWQAALSQERGEVADRFEVYLKGLELGNAFAEELDPRVVAARWQESDEERRAKGKAPHPRDPAFLEAMGQLPRCAGIAIGFDRLVMALIGANDIAEVQVR